MEQAQCYASHELPAPAAADCDLAEDDRDRVIQTLIFQDACTDSAVDVLTKRAAIDVSARSLNDLAVGYYVRGQRQDRPSDLLRSYVAARRALNAAPSMPEAQFNLALVAQALGLNAEATAEWGKLAGGDEGPWTEEARARWRTLTSLASRAAASNPSLMAARLTAASADPKALSIIVSAAPAATQRYVEDELLPGWAQAQRDGRTEEAERQLVAATAIAAEIARQTGDRCLLDAAEAIERTDASAIRALEEAFLAFGQARRAEPQFGPQSIAAYSDADAAFARVGNPFRAVAALRRAIAQSVITESGRENSMRRLREISDEARVKRYDYVWIRAQAMIAFDLVRAGRFIDALDLYRSIRTKLASLRDREETTRIALRISSIYRALGDYELAWREALSAQRSAVWLDSRVQQALLEECASAVLGLGYPEVALVYQDTAVGRAQETLQAANADSVAAIRIQLAGAISARATINLYLGRLDEARRDIAEATSLSGSTNIESDSRLRAIRARINQVRGELLLDRNPTAAAAAFTEAMQLIPFDEYRTFRANLLAQRAAAYAKAAQRDAAERDLHSAYDELRAAVSQSHGTERWPNAWSTYFSQTGEVYRRLVKQLVDAGRIADAFRYTEQARSIENLNVRFRGGRPAISTDAFDIGTVQRQLPPNTLLFAYFVLERETLVWVLSPGRVDLVRLPVGRHTIERWTADIQRAAAIQDSDRMQPTLFAAFEGLIAPMLKRVDPSFASAADRNLVIVPDGAMFGLPFSALRDPVTRRYLAENYAVAVASSSGQYLASLLRAERGIQGDGSFDILLIGDAAFRTDLGFTRDLAPLMGAERELREIGALWPQSTVIGGAESTREAFFKLAPTSDIVHFAGHAIVESRAPFRSTLLFAPSRENSGLVSAEDVLTHLQLAKTRLVVLSTCSSAGGLPVGPEGFAPMAGSFLAVGASAVIGSLWSTPDVPTGLLMVRFHRHYREGNDAARALRLAQLDLLRSRSAESSPITWAAFQVWGYAQSPFERSSREALPR